MSSTARITEIDISWPARALRILRWSETVLVMWCGLSAFALGAQSVVALGNELYASSLLAASMATLLGVTAYIAWQHVGVIDPRVWSSYLWVLPSLGLVSMVLVVVVGAQISRGGRVSGADVSLTFAGLAYLQNAAVAIPGFVSVLLLRRMRVARLGVRVRELIESLNDRGSEPAVHSKSMRRINRPRGLTYGIIGLALVLVPQLVTAAITEGKAANVVRWVWFISSLIQVAGFFLILRARRYFQIDADALLAVDKRPPVLFLRSFADDPRQIYRSPKRALLDFSLETRLANHFRRFGPFIAIGSPKETVPLPGAARVRLSDDQWQARVLEWMTEASVIIMYCGTTQWVNWELRQVVQSGTATRLILMFPETRTWWSWRRRRDITARTQQIREVFRDTPWTEELTEFTDFARLRAMLFRADGSMLMARSRSRSRDAYHLAALIAHQQLLGAETVESVALRRQNPVRRRAATIAALVASAAVVVSAISVLNSGLGHRMTFHKGDVFYKKPVTLGEAQRVGEFLVEQQYFNAQNASAVQLAKDNELYKLRFVVNPAAVTAPWVTIQYGLFASGIAQSILGGKPLEVTLNDQHMNFVKTVPPSAKLAFGKGVLFYTHPINVNEARAVGEQLVEMRLFTTDRGNRVHLGREDATYQLRFIIDLSRGDAATIVAGFAEIAGTISAQALGGEPIVLHLSDNDFRTLHSKRIEHPKTGALEMLAATGFGSHRRVTFQRGELYYNDAVTQAEAQNVGEFLLAEKFFTAEGAATAQLLKDGARYQLRLAVRPEVVENPLLALEIGLIAGAIAQNILGGSPLEVTLVDEMLRPRKIVPPTARLEFGKSALLYTHPVTVTEARRVGKQLVATTVFAPDSSRLAHLAREEGIYQLRFAGDPARANESELVTAVRELGAVIATEALGGKPIVVHLCDREFRTLHRQRIEPPKGARRESP